MAKQIFKGFMQVDGTAQNFSTANFENGYIYFVRTSSDGEDGYIWFNGKIYGQDNKVIDCGNY